MMINSYKLVNQPWENGAKLDFQDTVIFVCCLQERMLGRGHRHAFFPYIYIYLPTNPSHHSSKNLRIPCEEMFGLPKGLLLFGVPNTYSQGIRKTSERVMIFSCFLSHRKASYINWYPVDPWYLELITIFFTLWTWKWCYPKRISSWICNCLMQKEKVPNIFSEMLVDDGDESHGIPIHFQPIVTSQVRLIGSQSLQESPAARKLHKLWGLWTFPMEALRTLWRKGRPPASF